MSDDEKYMLKALEQAKVALQKDEVPIGAIVVCNGQIISRTYNLTETLNDVTAHAEMQAITASANFLGGKYLTDCTLYVTVEPCPMCAGALAWAQVKRIVYGASDEKRGAHHFSGVYHPKTEIVSGVLADECSALVKEFFQLKRK